eukprot:GHRQ01021830.1.p1 GENE.GHRQ01021830.1~~GHRQ01021830.1.p1  ORF type:complete len:185 (+),score=9.77 GHRQ01021830.1:945-1499(+)
MCKSSVTSQTVQSSCFLSDDTRCVCAAFFCKELVRGLEVPQQSTDSNIALSASKRPSLKETLLQQRAEARVRRTSQTSMLGERARALVFKLSLVCCHVTGQMTRSSLTDAQSAAKGVAHGQEPRRGCYSWTILRKKTALARPSNCIFKLQSYDVAVYLYLAHAPTGKDADTQLQRSAGQASSQI